MGVLSFNQKGNLSFPSFQVFWCSFQSHLMWVQSQLVCSPPLKNNIFHLGWKNFQNSREATPFPSIRYRYKSPVMNMRSSASTRNNVQTLFVTSLFDHLQYARIKFHIFDSGTSTYFCNTHCRFQIPQIVHSSTTCCTCLMYMANVKTRIFRNFQFGMRCFLLTYG